MPKTIAGYPDIDVAVTIIQDEEGQILWIWNEEWGCFALPMSQVRGGPDIDESPHHAAARAAARALGVPVQVEPLWDVPSTGHAPPNEPAPIEAQARPVWGKVKLSAMWVSGRDYKVKHYNYCLFQAKPHPHFADAVRPQQPCLWLSAHGALSGLYEPLSHSVLGILRTVVEKKLIRGRKQETCQLVICRGKGKDRRVLLRFNSNWGYALPAKRKGPKDDALAVAAHWPVKSWGLTRRPIWPLSRLPRRWCGPMG